MSKILSKIGWKKKLPERKIGGKKSKIGSCLLIVKYLAISIFKLSPRAVYWWCLCDNQTNEKVITVLQSCQSPPKDIKDRSTGKGYRCGCVYWEDGLSPLSTSNYDLLYSDTRSNNWSNFFLKMVLH